MHYNQISDDVFYFIGHKVEKKQECDGTFLSRSHSFSMRHEGNMVYFDRKNEGFRTKNVDLEKSSVNNTANAQLSYSKEVINKNLKIILAVLIFLSVVNVVLLSFVAFRMQ